MNASDLDPPAPSRSRGESIPPVLAATPPARAKKKLPVRQPEPEPDQQQQGAAPLAAIPAPAQDAVAAAEEISMDTIDTVKDQAATFKDQAESFAHDAQSHAQDGLAKGQKLFDEWNAFAKGNVEALVESSKIAARGLESLGQDYAAYAKRSFEGATGAMKTLATVKSPTEFVKLQSDYARDAFDQMVAETSRGTETLLKLAGEIAQPLSNRVAVAVEKVKVAA